MKKIISLFFVVIFAICACACTSRGVPRKTEYDGKVILKIETLWQEGFAAFPCDYVRTFDFEHGKVTDTWKADEEYLDASNRRQYNCPKKIATFSEEQGQALVDKIGGLGFFDWEERYITEDEIVDAGAHCVNVYFADGTKKSTLIYFLSPPNYVKISEAIEDAFGVTMFLQQ